MRGTRFFLEAAKRHGVCFGAGIIGGEAEELVFDEVKDFTFMLTRHETTAGVMADAYARLTGQAQLAYSTFGPGMTNLLTGIACAALDRSPMLAVSAQVPGPEIAYGHTHQCLDMVAIARSVTKFAHELTHIEEIPEVVAEAMRCAREGLEGPSFISFPRDVMGAAIDDKSATAMLERMPSAAPAPPGPPKPTVIKWLADQLQSAKRPIAIVGNLVYKHGAQRQLEAFASRYQIPVVTTLASKGILPESHLLNVGPVNKYLEGFLSSSVLNEVFGTADLILLIGFDIAEDVKPDLWRRGLPKKEILLTPFPNPVGSLVKGDREIVGDLSAALNSLSELGSRPESRDLALIGGLKLKKKNYGNAGTDDAAPTPAGIVRAMRKAIGPKGILCSDIGLHKQIAGLFTETADPNTFFCSNGLGSFGTGLGLGLGAKVARPDLPVAIVVGDGGFHSNSQDLETAVRYNIPVIIVVLKDDAYGLIKFYQLKGHKRLAQSEVQLGSVDFVGLAKANGCAASRITRNDELESALVRAIASGAPALLEVPICYNEVLQLLTVGGISEPEPDRKPFIVPIPSMQSNDHLVPTPRCSQMITEGPSVRAAAVPRPKTQTGTELVPIPHPHVVQFGTESVDILDPRLDSEPLGDSYWKVLHAFVTDTYETCRYYRDRLDRASLAANKLRSWDDFQAIPPLAPRHVGGLLSPDNRHPASEFDLLPDLYRATLRDEGVSSRTAGDRLVRRFMTSSTTGRPKVSYYTEEDWAWNCASSWRQHRHIPQSSLKNVFNCFHAGHYGGKNVEDTFTRVAGCLVVNRHFSYTTPEQVISQLCSGLGEMGEFSCLAIPPCNPALGAVTKGVSLHDLLPLDTDNYIGRNVRVVTLGGSRADEKVYRLRERLWEANRQAEAEPTIFLEKYGCSELGMAAAECERNDGMHLYQGFIYTEILNERTWRRVRSGERGLVAMTGLRKGSRFLRYIVGDEATFVDEPCACGRRSPRIMDVQRVFDLERLRGGCASATSQRDT